TLVAPDFVASGVSGSAIGGYGSAAQAQLRVYNSIVQGSCANGLVLDHAEGSISTGGDSCLFDAATNHVHATAAQLALGALADHGGSTRTYLPATNSNTIDAGTAYGCLGATTDQRGYARRSGSACDAGSVEVGSAAP
ncbi:MAG: choice-of-anchor Q domain-containing protein, partial [Dokdonella sp.]